MLKVSKYLLIKNNIDLPIIMIEVFDFFPPILDGQKDYTNEFHYLISGFFMNF